MSGDDEDTRVRATDIRGLPLPDWVPPDHPLAGTILRPDDLDNPRRRESFLELWFPTLAMAPAPVALFVLWLRNPDNAEAIAAGNWTAGAVVMGGGLWLARVMWRSR